VGKLAATDCQGRLRVETGIMASTSRAGSALELGGGSEDGHAKTNAPPCWVSVWSVTPVPSDMSSNGDGLILVGPSADVKARSPQCLL
jgi:hypothetical protein